MRPSDSGRPASAGLAFAPCAGAPGADVGLGAVALCAPGSRHGRDPSGVRSSDDARGPSGPRHRRSATIRAAALVTLSLGAAGCDEAPAPDLPGQTEARLEACRAAHRRLGEDPARCDALEQAIARGHGEERPHFATVGACETLFGRGACEGETLAAVPPNWRPALAGWTSSQQPVLRDRAGAYWALPEPTVGPGGLIATQAPPRAVSAPDQPPTARLPIFAYYRLSPIYPDEATCSAEWQACQSSNMALPNRFATREACSAVWSQCAEVDLPESALVMAAAESGPASPGGGAGTSGTTGSGVRPGWWIGYNAGYRQRYAGGIGPRYQGWTWSANRVPTVAYRPAVGTGPLQAWDSGSRSLAPANRMGVYSSGSGTGVTRSASVSRAGFGSTGRSYSSGG